MSILFDFMNYAYKNQMDFVDGLYVSRTAMYIMVSLFLVGFSRLPNRKRKENFPRETSCNHIRFVIKNLLRRLWLVILLLVKKREKKMSSSEKHRIRILWMRFWMVTRRFQNDRSNRYHNRTTIILKPQRVAILTHGQTSCPTKEFGYAF